MTPLETIPDLIVENVMLVEFLFDFKKHILMHCENRTHNNCCIINSTGNFTQFFSLLSFFQSKVEKDRQIPFIYQLFMELLFCNFISHCHGSLAPIWFQLTMATVV